jgi:hypothetical protein
VPSSSRNAASHAKPARNRPRAGAPARAVLLALALGGTACAGAREPPPVAALGDTTDAAILFAPIREEWDNAKDTGHARLRRELEHFLDVRAHDGLAPLARVYLVLSLTDEPADWPRVDEMLPRIPEPPPGTVRDLYLIASARQLRHHGQPEAAFDLLTPLVGKMVDPVARGMLEEEVTHDALEAHHDYEAIAYMDAWMRGSGEEQRDVVQRKVGALLADLSPTVLENALRAMRSQSSGGYGVEIEKLVTQRLAAVAITNGDPVLARWLLDPAAGPGMIGGPVGIQLGELATSRRGLGAVTGRTVGLLLPTGSNDLRDEAADVERGVAWALDLPRTRPDAGDGTRLVTRDDGGDPERMIGGLEELAGEGASIILTALDAVSADRALEWGDKNRIAVVVIAAPQTRKPGAFTFVAGEQERGVIDLLTAAIVARQGAESRIAPVVEGDATALLSQPRNAQPGSAALLVPTGCDVESPRAGEPRFPVAAWERQKVRAWLVAGSADCARDLMREQGPRARGAVFALSLIAGTTAERPAGAHLLVASAGVIPGADLTATPAARRGARTSDGSDATDAREADVQELTARVGGRPNWWTALGRDAGMLARRALATAPMDSVTSASEVSQRRKAARDALAASRDRLWTTDAPGFDATHVLPRQIHIRTVDVP